MGAVDGACICEGVHIHVGQEEKGSEPQAGAYDFPFCSSKFEPVCWVILKLYLLREHVLFDCLLA